MTGIFSAQGWLLLALLAGIVFVNGWTDAPNAVATCVASGAMPMRRAINMAAVFNFLGLLAVLPFGAAVGEEISAAVPRNENALTVLCAAMISVVAFAVFAWYFGVPTSESHALVSALSGAAAAAGAGITKSLWISVFLGILITSGAGFLLGLGFKRAMDRSGLYKQKRALKITEILCAALLSLIHGAQDGQKFSALIILTLSLSAGREINGSAATLFCALLLGAGTAVGGARIIKKVGNGITVVDEGGGVCCDAAAFVSILVCTVFGMPVSTTHTKTSAILGVGAAGKRVNLKTFSEIFSLWLLTFPVCFGLGYVIARLCI